MSNLIRPFDLFDEFDRVYGRLFDREPPRTAGPTSEGLPPVDISETPEGYVIEMEVPGLRAGDVAVSVLEGVLTVKGNQQTRSDRQYLRAERRQGSFTRQFRLPVRAAAQDLKAEVRDGLLSIVIPKALEASETRVEIS